MRLGYIMFTSPDKEDDINRLKAVGCEEIFVDRLGCEEKRSQWRRMLNELRRNDEIVILQLGNAVRELVQVASFFEICRMKKVRIISLRDKFDSWDEMFPSSTTQLIDAIGAFAGDTLEMKISSARISAARKKKKSSFQNSKEEKEKYCVDLYANGTSIEDIKEEIGYSSNSSVYRILKNKGVKVNRRNTKKVSDE